MIGNIKGIIDKVASRKLAVTAVVGAAAATGAVEITWPIAAIAMAYPGPGGGGCGGIATGVTGWLLHL